MTTHRTSWLIAGLLCLALSLAHACAQSEYSEGEKKDEYSEAEKMLEGVLSRAEGCSSSRPSCRPDVKPHFVSGILNDLAKINVAQGKYAKAERRIRRALAIREKAFGPEHPSVAQSLNDLANLYQAQGQYVEAEPLYKRALASFEKALGAEHPYVAQSLENYAALLRNTERNDEAEKLEVRAKAIRGKQHRMREYEIQRARAEQRQEREKAHELLVSKAREGDPEAQFKLYSQAQPSAEGLRWLCLAANRGHRFAQEELGDLYASDLGQGWRALGLVKLDYILGYMWYSLAESNGLRRAGHSKGQLAKTMTPAQIFEAMWLVKKWKPGSCELKSAGVSG